MKIAELLDTDAAFHYGQHGEPISWAIGTEVLRYLQDVLPPGAATLETGAGLSTVFFAALGCRHIAVSPDGREFDNIRRFCAEHDISADGLTLVCDRSEHALPRLELPTLDLALIDGRHAFPSPYIDWFYLAEALAVGGLMVVDDTQLLTGHELKAFLTEDTHWQPVREFSKTAIFRKLDPHVVNGEWNLQPYIVNRQGALESANHAGDGGCDRSDALATADDLRSDVMLLELRSHAEYETFVARSRPLLERRREVEAWLVRNGIGVEIDGRCAPCDRHTSFLVTEAYSYEYEGRRHPNWREQLTCCHCDLSNRQRASLHLLRSLIAPGPASRIYATEQVTPMFAWLQRAWPTVVGSEYLGDRVARGACDADGVRNEDITRLSFDDGAFDVVISFDVLEHVPDFTAALREFARVLDSGGQLLLSVPFSCWQQDNLVRAEVRSDGSIHHHVTPEYHGDPLSSEGCLAFYTFGWELLADLRRAGFADVSALLYWSRLYGYLGANQIQFVARKS